ncbi:MAG: cysteine desulfurase NifS [Chloroflexi bacterium HGW-Chloroflexi-3]|nr:MAG: cysteine desulfurase NifS [Chloroflexi bacterium HGW-Chloroflexi-3]
MKPIYLDYNATTPIAKEVADAMLPYLYDLFGNPSSSHQAGAQAKMAVEFARRQVADLIGAQPTEIIFTSGGTEANNHAVRGYCELHQDKGRHIVTSAVEHPAVLEVCRDLERNGFELTILSVDPYGQVNPHDLEAAIRADTILISIMHANNEVGTLQPLKELTSIAKSHGIAFHTDAAQSIGKIAVNVNNLGVDLLSIAGHKLYAPKGVGALYVRDGIFVKNLMYGAGHENGKRPGTENILEIVGLGKASAVAARDLSANQQHLISMREFLYDELVKALGVERLRVNGHPSQRLPNTLSLGIHGIESHQLLNRINHQVAISAGSACHADSVTISGVLKAMQVPDVWAQGTLRFSVGRETTGEEIREAVTIIRSVILEN